MIRPIITAVVLFTVLGLESGYSQQDNKFKRFVAFKQIVAGIDFYASNRQLVTPYEKPAAEAIERLKSLFGPNLPKGAIFICSTLEQKDSVYEPMVLKNGYAWMLMANTPEVRMQEMMERMKSQMGGSIPAEMLARIKNRPPEMMADAEKQLVSSTIQQMAYAVIQTFLDKELKFRSSRLDDMSKSPLPDWLDIGIASYVSGVSANVSYLQQHMDQTFPLEDVIAMSRPFVASSYSTQGGGSGGGGNRGGDFSRMGGGEGAPQGMPNFQQGGFQGASQGGFGGRGASGGGGFNGGGFNGGGSGRGGGQRNMSKDEQDRTLFDAQASTFFAYLVEKIGIEKATQLVKYAQDGKESREYLTQADVLGSDFSKVEEDWANWVKALKVPQTQRMGFPGQ